jgi:hypothetical protein
MHIVPRPTPAMLAAKLSFLKGIAVKQAPVLLYLQSGTGVH